MIKSRRVGLEEHVAGIEAMRNAYKLLVRKPEGNKLLERPRRRWEDNNMMDLK
jgi:hypothetical protein